MIWFREKDIMRYHFTIGKSQSAEDILYVLNNRLHCNF
jgi:hypothetical protein